MLNVPTQRAYRLIVAILIGVSVVVLGLVAAAWVVTRPPGASHAAATLTAAPVPTPVPTLAGVNPKLLLCQRQAGQAMHTRQMVGAVNLADDRRITFQWISQDWAVSDLDSALAGVMSSLDVALEVWQEGCMLYDRIEVEVYDREGNAQNHRLTVTAQMDDALSWRMGRLSDAALLARLEVEPTRRLEP
jgi:hypothetical protein